VGLTGPEVAARFAALYEGEPTAIDAADEPSLKVVAGQVAALKTLKTETIEPDSVSGYSQPARGQADLSPALAQEPAAGAPAHCRSDLRAPHRRALPTASADPQGAVEINMVSSYAAPARRDFCGSTKKFRPKQRPIASCCAKCSARSRPVRTTIRR